MEKELVQLFEVVKKSADAATSDGGNDSSPEEDRCLDALRRLKKFPVNYQVLVSTQVGKRLRYLTKHPRKKIQSLASEVVEIWKGIIVEETIKNRKNGILNDKSHEKVEEASAGTSGSKKVRKLNSVKGEKDSGFEIMKVEKEYGNVSNYNKSMMAETSTYEKVENVSVVKTLKDDANDRVKTERTMNEERQNYEDRKLMTTSSGIPKLTSIVYCKDPIRDKVRELLAEALCKVSSEVDDDLLDDVNACDPFRVAVTVESAMFEKWGRSNGAQKFKYRSIMFNIKDQNNPDFRRKVLLGYIPPECIVELIAEDMASDQRQKQNSKIKEKALFECERGMQSQATTDQFQCGRCKQKKCTYYQMQTRSADEPMTTYVTCVNCNNRWKFC